MPRRCRAAFRLRYAAYAAAALVAADDVFLLSATPEVTLDVIFC